MACNESGFNGDRARSAEGIDQWEAAIITSREQQGGSEGLAQRGFRRFLSVSALMEQVAGTIHTDRALVVYQPYQDELSIVAELTGAFLIGECGKVVVDRSQYSLGYCIRMV